MGWILAFTSGSGGKPFYDASRAFNVLSFWTTTAGTLIGLVGFAITIGQVRAAKRAAEAAEDAAKDVRQQLSTVAALADVSSLVTLAQEVLTHIGHQDFSAAAIRSQDLRSGIARFRFSAVGKLLLSGEQWQDMVTIIGFVNEQVADMQGKGEPDLTIATMCQKRVADVHEQLSGLVGEAAHRAVAK